MNPKITEKDVFLYHAGLLDPAGRRSVEEACRTNPQVQAWYEEYSTEPAPRAETIDLDDPKVARLAAVALEIVARTEETGQWEQWERWLARPTPKYPSTELAPRRVHQVRERLLYHDEVPILQRTGTEPITIPPTACPCVEPDYARGYLKITQAFDALTDGRIDIVVVRLREGQEPARYRIEGYQLQRARSFWYDDIALNSILRDGWEPGDTFVYAVEAVPASGAEGR